MPVSLHGLSFIQRPNGPRCTCTPVYKGRRCALRQLAERQKDFAMALLDAARAPPTGLVGPDGIASSRRFGVYRNNVVAGLIETLKENYPAVHRIVGSEFFRAMAAQFVTANPPHSPVMLDYGAGFAKFIARFEPVVT